MRTRHFAVVAFLASIAGPFRLAAQSQEDVRAYLTLLGTPAGGLSPMLSNAMLDVTTRTPNLALRYGHVSVTSTTAVGNSIVDNSAVTLSVPVGRRAQVGITGEYEKLRCDLVTPDSSGMTRTPSPCLDHVVVGANGEVRLSSTPIGTGPSAPHLTVGVNTEAGYARPMRVTQMSLSAGVPIALAISGPAIRIAPFFTPGLGWAHFAFSGVSESGLRPTLGGGIALQSTSTGLAANVGFRKVFINRGDTVLGLSLALGL